MNKMLLFALALIPTFSVAKVEMRGKYDSYVIHMEQSHPVKVKVISNFETEDSCNRFGIYGSFRAVKPKSNSWTIVQDFVADFGVVHTEIACPPSPGKRSISLESDELEIEPIKGTIFAHILVPENMKLEVKE